MRHNFGTYTYNDPDAILGSNNINDYAFKPEEYDNYIKSKDYEGAYRYGMKYIPNDEKKAEEYITNLRAMRDEMPKQDRIIEIAPHNVKQAMLFNKHYNTKTLGALSDTENEYYDDYNNYFKTLGSNNGEATGLQIEFHPEKASFLGLDRLSRDNTDTSFNAFLRNSKLTIENLRNAGVTVDSKEDGSVILQFGKDNTLFNTIIDNVPTSKDFGIISKNYLILPVLSLFTQLAPRIKGIDSEGNIMSKDNVDEMYLVDKLKETIQNAKLTEENYRKNPSTLPQEYVSGILTKLDDDEMMDLIEAKNSGEIDKDEFNKRYNASGKGLWSRVRMLQDHQGEIYASVASDYDASEDPGKRSESSNSLNPLNAQERKDAVEEILALEPSDAELYACVSDGRYGVYIRARSVKDKDGNIIKTHKDYFIPGFLLKDVQKKVYNDPKFQAAKKINDMGYWNTTYTTVDNKTIRYTENGLTLVTSYKDNYGINREQKETISEDEAKNLIALDIIKEDGLLSLNKVFTNEVGEIFDTEAYLAAARKMAIGNIYDVFGEGFSYYDENSRSYMPFRPTTTQDIDYIFANKDEYLNSRNGAESYRYNKMLELYNYLMSNMYRRTVNK